MTNSFKTLLFLSVLISANASAAIQYANDGRYISHSGNGVDTIKSPITPFGAFNKFFNGWEAGAFQDSSMNSTSMKGSGSVYAGPDAIHYGAGGGSVYNVTFTVDQITNFSLSGAITNQWSYVNGSLLADNIALFSVASTNPGVAEPFSFKGVFTPGTEYRLLFDTYTNYSAYNSEGWEFALTTSVPEPAATWLMGAGLFLVMGVARRKATRQSTLLLSN